LSRGDLTEAEWRPLKELLPAERGRKSRPAFDNRPIVNRILWCIGTGAPWRDLRLGPPARLHDKLVPDAGQ
jgi:transposase